MIQGVEVLAKRCVENDKGAVLHCLRSDSLEFGRGIGEVYFSCVHTGALKGWKRHKIMVQRFTVPVGAVRFVVHDDRPDSATRGQTATFLLSRSPYQMLILPPLVWYSFRGEAPGESLIVNCASIPHDPLESENLPIDELLPGHWSKNSW